MEVHHHPIATGSQTARRKWTHYFREFLMLFLAVFCGFLAEYQLEHTIEHQREKQYAKQLLADLRADSLFFAKRVGSMNGLMKKHQQFYQLMTQPVKPSDKDILSGCLPLLYTFDVLVTTATYSQMKASGGLRYIKKENLTNVLQKYYEVLLPRVTRASDGEGTYYRNNIDPFVLKYFRVQDFDFVSDSVKTSDPIILNRTSQSDQELLNIIEGYAGSHKVIQERLTLPAIKTLNTLIDLLKKEYRLK
ncbi:MAG TPA: hypothetical protein VJ765_08805 [Chitinophagaceae bacterium]|nr:hypothetical protein [Chitinophagaceae bacterium]